MGLGRENAGWMDASPVIPSLASSTTMCHLACYS